MSGYAPPQFSSWRGRFCLYSSDTAVRSGAIMEINRRLSTTVKSKHFYMAMTAVVAFLILAFDVSTDVDINAGVLYIIVVFMSLRFCDTRGVIIVTLCCAVLTVIGWYLSSGNIWGITAITNRLLGFLAVGFATYLGLRDREAHIALQEAWVQLARANRVATLGELTASIGHEIKQPLAAIINDARASLHWLAAQPPDLHEVKASLEMMISGAQRASDITDRVRALVKKEPTRKDSLNLNDVISEVLLFTRSDLLRNRILVRTHLASDPWSIPGDRIQLQQVLLNLILNAVEAMTESDASQRELVITSTNDGSNGVLVMVRDAGKGLSADDLANLFTAFFTSKPTGMGIGLSISRSIVELHSGRLWATQNERSGATFHVWLPVGSTASSAANEGAPRSQPLKLNL